MSHVDEGTLHAYLDGELTPVERERVAAHLTACPACRARLAEEQALIERASRLLGVAAPPERAMPPLQELRPPRSPWRLWRPLAWAATVVLAVGVGWFTRGVLSSRRAIPGLAEQEAQLSTAPASSTAGAPTLVRTRPAAPPMVATAPARQERALPNSSHQPLVADGEPASGQVSGAPNNALATRRTPDAKDAVVSALGGQAPAIAGPQAHAAPWPPIDRQPARDLLGTDPVVIPGFAVRAYRRNPAAPEIVVEQVSDAGTTISLFERRVDAVSDERRADGAAANVPRATAKSVDERLARFVGPLRVEIEGPLTPDSLSSLLELAR